MLGLRLGFWSGSGSLAEVKCTCHQGGGGFGGRDFRGAQWLALHALSGGASAVVVFVVIVVGAGAKS